MIKLFLFFRKIQFVLLFVILESLAVSYYANSTSYSKAKLVSASNQAVAGVNSVISEVGDYFLLKSQNRQLLTELAAVRNELDSLQTWRHHQPAAVVTADDSTWLYSSRETRSYVYFPARTVNNSFTRQENYLTLDQGAEDGLAPNMAVVSNGGIAGYVLSCSEHYAVCMSVLNRNFNTSGRIKGSEYFGSVYWDGVSYEYVTLTEIPKYAPMAMGDTIVTTDYSSIFPPDVNIGTVESFELRNATYYEVKVRLHADFTRIRNVLAVKYMDAEEREALERSLQAGENF